MSWRFVVPPTPPESFADAVMSNAEAHVKLGFSEPTPTEVRRLDKKGNPVTETDADGNVKQVMDTVLVETHYAKVEQIAQLRLLAAAVAKAATHLHESGQLGAVSALSADIQGHAVPSNNVVEGHESISIQIIGSSAHGQPPT